MALRLFCVRRATLFETIEELDMDTKEDAKKPGKAPNETKYEKEPKDREGTMGGQTPLNAPAGIQKPGPGGVLTETGKQKKE